MTCIVLRQLVEPSLLSTCREAPGEYKLVSRYSEPVRLFDVRLGEFLDRSADDVRNPSWNDE